MDVGVGIDFGNSNSSIAIKIDKKTYWPISARGYISSNIIFDDNYVGLRDLANLNSRIGLSRIKRILNSYPEIPDLEDIEIKLENEEIMVHDNKKWVSLKNVLGSIFVQFNKIILNFLGKQNIKNIGKFVITVPAHYQSIQKDFLRDSIVNSIDSFIIISEPIAAAISGLKFNFENLKVCKDSSFQKYLIYDLGGSTLDLTLANLNKTLDEYEILDSHGCPTIGGDNLTYAIGNLVTSKLNLTERNIYDMDVNYFFKKCENFKEELTKNNYVKVKLKHCREVTIGRHEYFKVVEQLREDFCKPIELLLQRNNIEKNSLNKVFVVGGGCRTPIIKEWLGKIFAKEQMLFCNNPEKIISSGAAIFSQETITKSMSCFTNHSIGIKLGNEKMLIIFPKNSKFPIEKTLTFATYKDNQEGFTFEIYEGDSEKSSENKLINVMNVNEIPLKPAKMVRIELKFSINEFGELDMILNNIVE